MINKENSELSKAFNHLIDDCSIKQLKSSLDSMFRAYLLSLDENALPLDYNQTVNNYYYLSDFLKELHLIQKSQEI